MEDAYVDCLPTMVWSWFGFPSAPRFTVTGKPCPSLPLTAAAKDGSMESIFLVARSKHGRVTLMGGLAWSATKAGLAHGTASSRSHSSRLKHRRSTPAHTTTYVERAKQKR